MDDRMMRALARWPDVPALYGWLSLDRRGRWCIQGELITRPQIIDTIGPRLVADQLFLVGLDVIGGKLIEVNVTSPTLIQQMSRLTGQNLSATVIARLEEKVQAYPV